MSALIERPVDWAGVSIREFDALAVLTRGGDVERALNAYWDALHADPANIFRGDKPNRLTPEGSAWLAELVALARDPHTSERAQLTAAREFITCLGFMATSNVARALFGGGR